MSYVIRLEKENFKFSGTHFTIFSPDASERLHGHNYYVSVELEVSSVDEKLGLAFDFNDIKPLVRQECQELDEYVLVPSQSPYIKLERANGNIVVSFKGKVYSFPKEDVRELPLVNITSEELAKYLAEKLGSQIHKGLKVHFLRVTVEESRGQSVTFSKKL